MTNTAATSEIWLGYHLKMKDYNTIPAPRNENVCSSSSVFSLSLTWRNTKKNNSECVTQNIQYNT